MRIYSLNPPQHGINLGDLLDREAQQQENSIPEEKLLLDNPDKYAIEHIKKKHWLCVEGDKFLNCDNKKRVDALVGTVNGKEKQLLFVECKLKVHSTGTLTGSRLLDELLQKKQDTIEALSRTHTHSIWLPSITKKEKIFGLLASPYLKIGESNLNRWSCSNKKYKILNWKSPVTLKKWLLETP